jgi:hypothetical protein
MYFAHIREFISTVVYRNVVAFPLQLLSADVYREQAKQNKLVLSRRFKKVLKELWNSDRYFRRKMCL